jgi:hypothetical protein
LDVSFERIENRRSAVPRYVSEASGLGVTMKLKMPQTDASSDSFLKAAALFNRNG